MPQQNATHVVVTLEYAMPSPAKGRVRENVTVEIPTPSAPYAEGAAADIEIAAPVVVGLVGAGQFEPPPPPTTDAAPASLKTDDRPEPSPPVSRLDLCDAHS